MNTALPTRASAPLLALLLTVLVAGCATLFERADEAQFEDDRVFVRVINNNFYDVTVYADWDGHRERLGRVVGNRTEVLALPARAGGMSVAIAVAVQAGRTHTTNRITAWPGEEIQVRVPPDLDRR
jgi:hypothetical protein